MAVPVACGMDEHGQRDILAIEPLFIALVPGRLGQLLCFGFQQLVERFFYAASYKFFEFLLDYCLV